eukprot:757982-Hanusia_phi.AAC.1
MNSNTSGLVRLQSRVWMRLQRQKTIGQRWWSLFQVILDNSKLTARKVSVVVSSTIFFHDFVSDSYSVFCPLALALALTLSPPPPPPPHLPLPKSFSSHFCLQMQIDAMLESLGAAALKGISSDHGGGGGGGAAKVLKDYIGDVRLEGGVRLREASRNIHGRSEE